MNKVVLSVVAALAVSAALPAFAADMPVKAVKAPAAAPSPWDVAFGAAIMSDYNFRGISQSDRGPSATAYFEPRFNVNANWQLYAGIAGSAVKLPTDPTAEIDFYAGVRPTFGPLALDLGFIYYYYPKERQIDGVVITAPPAFNTTLANTDFWEVYGKATYAFNDAFSVGANLYYTPNWLNSGANGTYFSGTAKYVLPVALPSDIGWFVSGELGYYSLGTTKFDAIAFPAAGGWDLPSYAYWNAGIGFTWKVFTLDLRYHDTDLSKEECNVLTADPGANLGGTPIPVTNVLGAQSKWCGAAFIAKLSFDLTLANLK